MRITIEIESSFDNWLRLTNYLRESGIELLHVFVTKQKEKEDE